MPSGATCLAYCFTRVGLTRILLPLERGVASTCTGEHWDMREDMHGLVPKHYMVSCKFQRDHERFATPLGT